jgi:serine/threonine-protein kinase
LSLHLAALLEGKYEILDKIGEGGIGSIYKVRHQLLDEIRVIKVLRAQVAGRDDLQQRLMKEAQTAIRLTHPNIARLHDLALAEDGTAYIVMEFIDGVSLDSLLAATGPPSLALALEIAKQSLKAIGYLHDEGFIHRDISPDNLMLTRDFQGGVRVKLIDLGIAKDVTQTSGVTAAGTFLGKVKYCPPELFRDPDGVTQLDQRSDNYSFGVTLYELLTGEYPFKGESFEELAAGHLFRPPLSFDATDPDGRVPEALREVVMGALAKSPDERPASADDFVASLEQVEVDEEGIAEELERKVEATARFLSKFEEYGEGGSTQAHLNAQFGVERTSGVSPLSVPKATDLAAAGGEEDADPEVETDAEGTVETVTLPHVRREAAPPSRRRGALFWALAAVGLVAVAAALTWSFFRPPGTSTRSADAVPGDAVPVVSTERWSPDATADVVDIPLMTEVEEGAAESAADEPVIEEAAPADRPALADPPAAGDAPPSAAPPPSAASEEPSPESPAAPASVRLLKAGPGVVPPKLLSSLEPSYPKPDKNEVVVTISALIAADGRVLAATVKQAPTFRRRYKEAALAAVNAADFEPATQDGVRGKMWVDVDVRFLP